MLKRTQVDDRPETCAEGCLGCNLIEVSPVTLRNGTVVCNECPAYRHETEVRHIAGLETNERRTEYLRGVGDKRGKEAEDRLRADVWEMMR